MKWFYKLISKIESDFEIVKDLKVKYNNQCYIRGNRVVNPYVIEDSSDKNNRVTLKRTIRYSKQIENVKKYAKEWVLCKDIVQYLISINEGVSEDIICNFVKELLNNGILITECMLELSEQFPLRKLLEIMKKCDNSEVAKEYILVLKKIEQERCEYETQQKGKGLQQYEKLHKTMQELQNNNNYLNVVDQVCLDSNLLTNRVKKQIEDFVELMLLFPPITSENDFLKIFKDEFKKHYGSYREVEIAEVLDEFMGLGNPYILSERTSMDLNKKKILKFFRQKIELSLKNKESTVYIEKKEVKDYFGIIEENDRKFYSKDFEMTIKILAASATDIDKGEFQMQIAPCYGSFAVGQMVHRFYDAFSNNAKNNLDSYYCEVQRDLYSEYLNADITFRPREGRINNICIGKRNYEYGINLGLDAFENQKEIDLSDIMIGYNQTRDNLYLKSRKIQKRIRAISDNMLTPNVDYPVVRLMREITYSQMFHPLNLFSALRELNYKYIPKICYKNIIISPEIWKIEKEDFSNWKDFNIFKEDFEKLMNEWAIPFDIYIFVSDRYLSFDLSLDIYWKYMHNEVCNIFKSRNDFYVHKCISREVSWIQDTEGRKYQAEFVVECLGEPDEKVENESTAEIPLTLSDVHRKKGKVTEQEKQILEFGEEGWYFLKLYLPSEECDDFIKEDLLHFINPLITQKLIEKFFFIRYTDPEFHIRLRIKTRENSLKTIEFIEEFLRVKKEEAKVSKVIIAEYEREIERYGGAQLLPTAEEVFFWDSVFGMKILESNCDKECGAFLGVYSILASYFETQDSMEMYLNQYVLIKDYHKEYKKKDRYYIEMISKIDEYISKYDLEVYYIKRNAVLKKYFRRLLKLDEEGVLTNTVFDLIV